MSYQIISKRFRPQKFHEVFEQQSAIVTIKNAIRMGRLSQAYLFCGGRGSGKTTLARLFAKAITCHNLSEQTEPCGVCSSCKEISSGTSLDIIEIDGASNRGIDDIRQLNETVGYVPSNGKYKIYIIDEVHMLTKEAFNALLKTLEEPPEQVKFFFATTEPHKVPLTILSRCQRFDLKRISKESIAKKLESVAKTLEIEIEPRALDFIADLADGSLRDAESTLDQLICFLPHPITFEAVAEGFGLPDSGFFDRFDTAYIQKNYAEGILLAQEIYDSGKDLTYFVTAFQKHFHTHLKAHLVGKSSPYTINQLLYAIDYLEHKLLKGTYHSLLQLEALVLHLLQLRVRVAPQDLIDRLERIPSQIVHSAEAETSSPPSSSSVAPIKEPLPSSEPPLPSVAPLKEDIQKFERLLRFAGVELNGSVKK